MWVYRESDVNSRRSHFNWPALIIGSMLTITLTLVTAARYGELFGDVKKTGGQHRASSLTVVEAPSAHDINEPNAGVSRMLGFHDLPNGTVEIVDVEQNTQLELVRSGEGAFLRGVLRALTRERLALGYGKDQPFELRYNGSQQLWLTDRATGTALLLNAFGAENTATFAKLLHADGVTGS